MSELLLNLIALRSKIEREIRLTDIQFRGENWQFHSRPKNALEVYLEQLDSIIALGVLGENQEESPDLPRVVRERVHQEKRKQEVRFAWSA